MEQADPFQIPLSPSSATYPRGPYNCDPTFEPKAGLIFSGYEALADRIAHAQTEGLRVLTVDGYHGVDWEEFRAQLHGALMRKSIDARWECMDQCLAPPDVIRRAMEPFLGGEDPLFGTHYPFGPELFFVPGRVAELRADIADRRGKQSAALTILYGCGASLTELRDQLWYIDIPKDVIQARARVGNIANFGATVPSPMAQFYKRSYFVEWPALNRLKRMLLPQIDLLLDGTDNRSPSAMSGAGFRAALHELSESPFRVRPWFFPGPWGGQFMKGHMGLDAAQPNYAWSFEMIVPENGIALRKDGVRLEFSFDFLMYAAHERVLGNEAGRQFQYEWPIRLDYLDTIDGGNLSTQCHPRPDYIRAKFGETFTQDETYYIVNAKPGARVYLGLTPDCEPEEFKEALLQSSRCGTPVEIDRFVNSEPSKPHDLFLIPNGTVHCSGSGNLVLEISSTPYIFTFKIYDYLRRDLEGNLRPINVERAFDNIRFDRRRDWVRANLVAKPRLLRHGEGWEEYVLMDRPEFFYEIHRLEFEHECPLVTGNRGLAVNLVEGEGVDLVAANGRRHPLAYLESMLIPAATNECRIINAGSRPCKLVVVYVRPGTGITRPLNDPDA